MKIKPWIEDNDPLIENYGLLNEHELSYFLNLIVEWNDGVSILKTDINEVKNGIQLLDFFDYSNKSCYLSLFEKICLFMSGEDEYLYWIPLSDTEDTDFKKFEPLMIAKTLLKKDSLTSVSRSFMQMLNGGYMLFDSKCRFVGVVIDGYYMLAFMKEEFMREEMSEYIANWRKVDDILDPLLSKDLKQRLDNILS
jgi:hypothetical protein